MPTLPYPDAVYRPNEAHPEAQQDNGLPTYDVVQPPKYDYGANTPSAAAAALGRPGLTTQASTNSVRSGLQVEMQQTTGQRIYTPLPSPSANLSATNVPMHVAEPIGQLQDVPLSEPARRN